MSSPCEHDWAGARIRVRAGVRIMIKVGDEVVGVDVRVKVEVRVKNRSHHSTPATTYYTAYRFIVLSGSNWFYSVRKLKCTK